MNVIVTIKCEANNKVMKLQRDMNIGVYCTNMYIDLGEHREYKFLVESWLYDPATGLYQVCTDKCIFEHYDKFEEFIKYLMGQKWIMM